MTETGFFSLDYLPHADDRQNKNMLRINTPRLDLPIGVLLGDDLKSKQIRQSYIDIQFEVNCKLSHLYR